MARSGYSMRCNPGKREEVVVGIKESCCRQHKGKPPKRISARVFPFAPRASRFIISPVPASTHRRRALLFLPLLLLTFAAPFRLPEIRNSRRTRRQDPDPRTGQPLRTHPTSTRRPSPPRTISTSSSPCSKASPRPTPRTSTPPPARPRAGTSASDGLVYTFHLRPQAKWSNGDPVTAQDFLYSWRRMLTPALGAEYSYMLYVVKNAEAYNTGKLTDFSQVGFVAPDNLTVQGHAPKSPTPYSPLPGRPQLLVSPSTRKPSRNSASSATAAPLGLALATTSATAPSCSRNGAPTRSSPWKKAPPTGDAAHVELHGINFYPIEERGHRGARSNPRRAAAHHLRPSPPTNSTSTAASSRRNSTSARCWARTSTGST